MTRLFVYGTLMGGEENHDQLDGAVFVGPARTTCHFTMVSVGVYPGIRGGGTTAIVGELYDVDESALHHLDEFEGHPHFYVRTEISLDDGVVVQAYVLPASHDGANEIVSGSWRDRRSRSRSEAHEPILASGASPAFNRSYSEIDRSSKTEPEVTRKP